jgi:phosphatidylserine/phosphatidylglycerophosphate/cardiolipin synthase-like enzyme
MPGAREGGAREGERAGATTAIGPGWRLIADREHVEVVVGAVLAARTSVWIATANVKDMHVEDDRAHPGRRRGSRRAPFRSILAAFAELAERGVELRLLHAAPPSRPFRAELARHPALRQGLAMRQCPRVHFKAVIVDAGLLYVGSANWTGAGLGAKGDDRRNFELGLVTRDDALLDQVQAYFDRIWSGAPCMTCKLGTGTGGPTGRICRPVSE